MSRPYISHFKYLKGKHVDKNSYFDRVITIAWTSNTLKNEQNDQNEQNEQNEQKFTDEIKYGGTVYTRGSKSDNWVRSDHASTARKRLEHCPVCVKLDDPFHLESIEEYTELNRMIVNQMVLKYGCWDRNKHNKHNNPHCKYEVFSYDMSCSSLEHLHTPQDEFENKLIVTICLLTGAVGVVTGLTYLISLF